MYSKLQYISQGETAATQFSNIQEALEAGCKWVQLRFKNTGSDDIKTLAKEVKRLCAKYNATFIINDDTNLAEEIGADGVHLGLTDMPIEEARKILGKDKLIGGTANTLSDVLKRVKEGADYIGLGPFRFTQTKEKLSPILDLKGYTEIMSALAEQNISIPIYAIGGITQDDVIDIMRTGVFGIAVSGVITNHADKKLLVEQFNALLYETINDSR